MSKGSGIKHEGTVSDHVAP